MTIPILILAGFLCPAVGVPLDRCEYMRTTLDVPESMLPREAAKACANGVLMLAKYASKTGSQWRALTCALEDAG